MSDGCRQLAAVYALDALEPKQRRAFEAHYPSCERCRAELAAYQATAALLAESVAVAAPATIKAGVVATIAQRQRVSPITRNAVVDLSDRRPRSGRRLVVLAAAAAVMVVLGIVGASQTMGPSSVEDLIAAPDTVVSTLEGNDGTLSVAWSGERDQVAILGNGIKDPGPGQAYALWFLLDDRAVEAGMFSPEEGTVFVLLDVDNVDPARWGVTVEPAAGSPQPTGDLVFEGAT